MSTEGRERCAMHGRGNGLSGPFSRGLAPFRVCNAANGRYKSLSPRTARKNRPPPVAHATGGAALNLFLINFVISILIDLDELIHAGIFQTFQVGVPVFIDVFGPHDELQHGLFDVIRDNRL